MMRLLICALILGILIGYFVPLIYTFFICCGICLGFIVCCYFQRRCL